ncbi:MAG: S1-C subfamily serine protease, partial [Mariniblastus sp.]
QAGLLVNDVITELAGMRVDTQKQFRDRFIKQRLKREPEMELVVLRQGKPVVLVVQLGEKNLPKPDSYSELATFADQFSSLESILDDVEHVVHSKVEGKPLEVRALRIQRSGDGLVVTKSSRVGEQPKIELSNGKRITATVVARDAKNDLVLLRARFPSVGGLDLSNVSNELSEKRGRLLLVPDSKGKGRVSIWGSKFIDVPRTRASAGYLGVQVGSSRNDVVFAQVMQGAAKKAGFKSGDVILKMDDTVVSRTKDVFDFLQDKDAYSKINIQIRRDETELTKEVILGARPMNETGHVADDLKGGKSLRRDGFSLVMSHDADLGAAECGGPVFDISGDFLGLNIARYSRTRCYVLPRTIVKAFVDANAR